MSKLILKNFFVYSNDTEKHFYTQFSDSVNIIHGRNTSGKSTLIQSILYTMGINDSKENLDEIIKGNVIFRLDCEINSSKSRLKLVFVRSDDTLVIRHGDGNPLRFDGINSNNSYEYGRYKELFTDLFGFDLKLQNKSELTKAPLEAAFLPYYISQSVGWIYIRESIGNYRFYKDFKFDYLDYYTGIKTGQDRLEKYELQKEKQSVVFELTQLNNYKSRNAGLKLAAILDERLKGKTIEYLEGYGELNNKLSSEEANYNKLCNSLSMLRGRQKILSQIIKNIKNQRPKIDQCPTCNQSLPGNLREFYLYSQDINDAIKEKERVSANIKKTTAKLNSAEKNVTSLRDEIKKEYDILNKFKTEGVDFNSWLDYQANLKMLENISFQTKKCEERISKIQGDIENLGNDSDIETLRSQKEKEFFRIFKEKTKSLKVKIPNNNKYRELYSMSSFPYQGVELHKIIMAYHFSFNEMLSKNSNVHKFPFMLDAIFKEDIDKKSREEIFKFVAEESKRDVQILFTVAEFRSGKNKSSDDYLFKISDVNDKYFSNKAKQICIGNAISERAFLSQSSLEDTDILHDAISLLETV